MAVTERVDRIVSRANAATKGHWIVEGSGVYGKPSGQYHGRVFPLVADFVPARENSTFIAHARDDVPALAKAVKAVLARHAPRPFADAELRAISPSLPEQVCDYCTNLAGRPVRFPCPDVYDIEDSIP